MGNHAVVDVSFDAIDIIEKDPTFGKNLHAAMNECFLSGDRISVPASSGRRMIHVNAATVVLAQHVSSASGIIITGMREENLTWDEADYVFKQLDKYRKNKTLKNKKTTGS